MKGQNTSMRSSHRKSHANKPVNEIADKNMFKAYFQQSRSNVDHQSNQTKPITNSAYFRAHMSERNAIL